MTPELILSPIPGVVYRALAQFRVSGKTMFLMLIKENFVIFRAMLERKDRHEFNGKR
jgi:hypothetical protein